MVQKNSRKSRGESLSNCSELQEYLSLLHCGDKPVKKICIHLRLGHPNKMRYLAFIMEYIIKYL